MTKKILARRERLRRELTESKPERLARLREEKAFQRITAYLQHAQKRVEAEHRVNAYFAIETSWRYFERNLKYIGFAESTNPYISGGHTSQKR